MKINVKSHIEINFPFLKLNFFEEHSIKKKKTT